MIQKDLKKDILVKKPKSKRPEKFVLGVYAGNAIKSGAYLDEDNVLEIGLGLKLPFSFKLFWFSMSPSLSVGQVSFYGGDNSAVSWVALESADFIPLKFPLNVHGAIGTVGPGFGIKGGIKATFNLGVDIDLGTSVVIANDIDGGNQATGFITLDLGVNYTLPF